MNNSLTYIEPLFRPPSEANSLILQITIGCSHNKCSFCEMYGSKKFHIKNIKEIEDDIKKASDMWPNPSKIFLADGDAFVLSVSNLEKICELIHKYFKNSPRISCYALPDNILKKTDEDLQKIRKAGISLLYYGVETGNEFVLKKICKGANTTEIKKGLLKAQNTGFDMSVTWILGLGGRKYSKEHVKDTAKLLSESSPKYISALTLMLPYGEQRIKDDFPEWEKITAIESLKELKMFVELYNGKKTIFRTNHASNYLAIKADLPEDKEKVLQLLKKAIKNPKDNIRPEAIRGL